MLSTGEKHAAHKYAFYANIILVSSDFCSAHISCSHINSNPKKWKSEKNVRGQSRNCRGILRDSKTSG